jgi:hypothetical protein
MMDYMLPKRVMSWKEAWEIYFEQNGGALFKDLARYGIRAQVLEQARRTRSTSPTRPGARSTTTAPPQPSTPGCRPPTTRWTGCRPSIRTPSTSTTARARALARAGEAGQALLQQDAADALPDLPDPDVLHRARRSDEDLLPRVRLQAARSTTSARTLQGDLRPRAGEVHPGLAAGAPDLPGQLLSGGCRPGGARLRPAGRSAQVLRTRSSAATTSTSKAPRTRRTSRPGAAGHQATEYKETPHQCPGSPTSDKTLAENGLGHKDVIRFRTPG